MWIDKVKYLGTYIYSFSRRSDLSCNVRKFYGQFNNILSVLGKYPHEMATLLNPIAYRPCCMGVKPGVYLKWSYTEPVLLAIIAFVEHFHVAAEKVSSHCSITLSYIADESRLIFWQNC